MMSTERPTMTSETQHLTTEAARLEALRRYQILDSLPDESFDQLARLAAQVCRTPYALISFVDETREWVKASYGWNINELPKAHSFAAQALRDGQGGPPMSGEDLFMVLNAQDDLALADNTYVIGPPRICFYASIPLVTPEGIAIGTLSVLDDDPRFLDDRQVDMLRVLARQTMALLDLNRRVLELTEITTVRSRAEESARWQARHDTLTGLPNRTLFLERVQQALSAYRPSEESQNGEETAPPRRRDNKTGVAVLFVDLDRFKRINDTLGHAAGDTLLREVAARFTGCLRPDDTLARLGGDEFTVLLSEVPTPNYATNVAKMLLRTLRRPIMIGSQELFVDASIGISTSPRDGTDAETLLKHADIAMYKAKEVGGYQAYSRKMNADGYQRLIEESDLRRAVERNEITLCYQPQVELETGRIVAVEALARWRHPDRGMVPPSHFIALAEQADLIGPLGDLVLRQACTDAARWRKEGFSNIRVGVNLSARQISQPTLFSQIESLFEEYGLPGSAMEIELTETALCANGDSTPQTLRALRALGVRVAVDDFGTGYSSLAYLRRFRVDSLKIDHAFVAGLGRETPDEALIRALIEMARALDLQVVAEGVETQVQCERLRSLGCHLVQGYLFSRPLTYDALLTLLQSARKQAQEAAHRELAHYQALPEYAINPSAHRP